MAGVLIIDAVLELYEAADFALWPIAAPPAQRLLSLSGDLSALEVGTAMAVLTGYNGRQRTRGDLGPRDGAAALGRLMSVESVVAPGGLRIRDTVSGVTASRCHQGAAAVWRTGGSGSVCWTARSHGSATTPRRVSSVSDRSCGCGRTRSGRAVRRSNCRRPNSGSFSPPYGSR